MRDSITTAIEVIGAVLVVWGVALIAVPLALILAGILLIVGAVAVSGTPEEVDAK